MSETGAQRLALLADKLRQEQCVLAFCGHFSAGKSTLVNRLAGSQILPASPIPTSANQVLIRHGEPGATVRLHDKGSVLVPPDELEQLSSLCADGDRVEAVEIRHPLAHVPEGLWLMDTPGVDSTDDSHRLVTESALYLADAVFYVMDYNHVQSEVNLQFARSLTEWGKPLYLIVNQIDKHVALELSFSQFRQSVGQAFADWGVRPQGLFFISLREPEHPLNEWDGLLAQIQSLGEQRDALLLAGVWNSARQVMVQEEQRRSQAEEGERERCLAQVGAGGPGPDAGQRLRAVQADLERLAQAPAEAVESLRREVRTILENAPLFPYATKELAQRYLEARKPGFRVGLFFTESKTRAEVEARLTAFHTDLAGKVTAHIQWLLQDRLRRFAEAQPGRHEAFEEAVRALSIEFGPAVLADLVKPQALGAKEYVPQYFKDVTQEVQLRYQRALHPLLSQAADLAAAAARQAAGPLEAEAARLAEAAAAAEALAAMAEGAGRYRAAWAAALGEPPAAGIAPMEPEQQTAEPAEAGAPPQTLGLTGAPPAASHAAGAPPAAATQGEALRRATALRLRDAAGLLAPLPGMARTALDLEQRAGRLAESRFTVALFGAFSAGKSSFANALMGLHLLPVSPNPTTAVITRITAPTAQRPHGHVHVIWKSGQELQREVNRALEILELPATGDLRQDLESGAKRSREATAPYAKPHAAFLSAAARGYGAVRASLGREESTGLDQFARLVADEQRSCFVKEITVYVDCPVTRQGITLVDTPGADSINARHTDVAFDYIKNADAILFVTYYNHAFARADQDFLRQLGRVKDSFALDKMFFVINAADLAQDEEELGLVVGHVRRNLQECGIRQARIFPVSSQTALWSRLHAAGLLPRELQPKLQARLGTAASGPEVGLQVSGMERFEADFYRFVITDLSQMAVDAALAELRRAAETIAAWLEASRQDEGARAVRLATLQAAEAKALALVAALDATPEASETERQIDELLFYVRRRVLVERFRSFFAYAFNPSALRSDTPDMKRALREALQEVLQTIAFDLAQEMQATALRAENAVNRQAQRVAGRAADAIAAHLPHLSGPAYTPIHPPVPAFSDGREYLDPDPLQKLLALFKSPEQFFAGGGRTRLADELNKAVEAPADRYLAAARSLLTGYYGEILAARVEAIRAELSASVADHVRGLSAALSGAGDSAQLEAILRRLSL